MESVVKKVYSNKGNVEVYNTVNRFAEGKCRILDAGCGDGALASRFFNDGHKVDGITLSYMEVDKASSYLRKCLIYNLEKGLPSEIVQEGEQYDFVICSHLLEHICFPSKLLNDIKIVLKQEGVLIVALPNLMQYRSRWELIKGDFEYQDSGVWDYTHFRWYTFASAQQLLKLNDFRIEKAWVSGEIPLYSFFKFLPDSIRKPIFKILTKISKGLFGGQLLFAAKKA